MHGGGGVRAAVCLLAAALALSLAPGTAAAQSDDTTPLSVVSVTRENADDVDRVVIEFSEALQSGCNRGLTFSVDDGDPVNADNHGRQIDPEDRSRMVFTLPESARAPGAVIKVFYDQPPPPDQGQPECRYRSASDNQNRVGSFGWNLSTGQQVATTTQIEAVFEQYFSGTHTLREIAEQFGTSYSGALEQLTASGGLSAHFGVGQADEGRTRWGQPGTENWVQLSFGYPREVCVIVDGERRCTDMSAVWGPQQTCGGQNEPGLHRNDHTKFFWACATPDGTSTQHGQWVPVKVPRPGIDYAAPDQLTTPPPGSGCNPVMQWDPIREVCIYNPAD